MHRSALASSALLLLLSGCQGEVDSAPAAAAPEATVQTVVTTPASGPCTDNGPPTIVRYRSEVDMRMQHSVHLLNPDPNGPRQSGCDESLPFASVVTLSYVVAGS